jgi:hypothetical protein
MEVTEYFWPTMACIVVMFFGQAISYRLGCKHGYARGHEDGRKQGATEVANMINGMRSEVAEQRESVERNLEEMEDMDQKLASYCMAEQDVFCVFERRGFGTPRCKYCGREKGALDTLRAAAVERISK